VRERAASALLRLVRDDDTLRVRWATCDVDVVRPLLWTLDAATGAPGPHNAQVWRPSHALARSCIALVHQLSQSGALRDALAAAKAHVTAARFWRAHASIRDLEAMSSYTVQNLLELAQDDTERRAVLRECADDGVHVALLACALLANESSTARGVTILYYCGKLGAIFSTLKLFAMAQLIPLGLIPQICSWTSFPRAQASSRPSLLQSPSTATQMRILRQRVSRPYAKRHVRFVVGVPPTCASS